ncbi:MAG: hypothetical protein BAA01_01545 [Bacillus thermozeamaize]|jgi:hypothetical protein|uniref:D-glutamate cyclase-like C-terminal domain-containing protein n=1 Tax=Bacillus thermozeamaize TaxID=230954 RepID=A0A1Y3PFG0_9BACI|nr:MAG: hypothetical protein BAA01_01545 [Bacillus thermozeamaize]
MLELIAERIDQMIQLDVASRNVIQTIYPIARQHAGRPLAMLAAERLHKQVKPKDVVFIATGWPDRPHITPEIAETDGPPGAAVLARALHIGLNCVPIVLIEEHLVPAMKIVLEATGLRVVRPEEAIKAITSSAPIHAAAVIGFPSDKTEAERKAKELVDAYQPAALVVVEKGGMNEQETIHTSRGADTTEHMAKVDYLVKELNKRGVLTIGIGDGGNEVGMGTIASELKRIIPYGEKCLCGCGGGITPCVPTDVLVAASISNWGAYGVAACLALLTKNLNVFHDEALEERLLARSADAQLIDGITGYVMPSADGLDVSVHKAFVKVMREVVIQGMRFV